MRCEDEAVTLQLNLIEGVVNQVLHGTSASSWDSSSELSVGQDDAEQDQGQQAPLCDPEVLSTIRTLLPATSILLSSIQHSWSDHEATSDPQKGPEEKVQPVSSTRDHGSNARRNKDQPVISTAMGKRMRMFRMLLGHLRSLLRLSRQSFCHFNTSGDAWAAQPEQQPRYLMDIMLCGRLAYQLADQLVAQRANPWMLLLPALDVDFSTVRSQPGTLCCDEPVHARSYTGKRRI
jgi:hypothetical protein